MGNAEILKNAIEKAEANGFVLDKHKHFCEIGRDTFTGEIKSLGAYQSIIFDHDFAKAFWGVETEPLLECSKCGYAKSYSKHDEQLFCPNDGRKLKETKGIPYDQDWRKHLEEMVLEGEPIKYLEEFLAPSK